MSADALDTDMGTSDPDLCKVVVAWPGLSDPIRRAMIALVDAQALVET